MWQGMSPAPGGDVGAASAGPDADVAGNPNGYHAMGLLDDLLLWHADDPPSASESLRNDRYLDLREYSEYRPRVSTQRVVQDRARLAGHA